MIENFHWGWFEMLAGKYRGHTEFIYSALARYSRFDRSADDATVGYCEDITNSLTLPFWYIFPRLNPRGWSQRAQKYLAATYLFREC